VFPGGSSRSLLGYGVSRNNLNASTCHLIDTVRTNMQKPMLGDPSGLTDTMWDMIVNALGALAISALGGRYMKSGQRSFIEVWIGRFIERNPRLFGR